MELINLVQQKAEPISWFGFFAGRQARELMIKE